MKHNFRLKYIIFHPCPRCGKSIFIKRDFCGECLEELHELAEDIYLVKELNFEIKKDVGKYNET